MGKLELIKLIEKMEESNPNYLDEQIKTYDHEQAMQRATGIQFFKKEDLPKIDNLLNILIKLKKERDATNFVGAKK